MQIELILEKEVSLEPGASYRVLKADGKKLVVERIEPDTTEPKNVVLGMFADRQETMDKVEAAIKDFQATPRKKRKMSEILEGYSGGLFKNAQEVDEFLRAERESWER
jgi:hypothetical protein